jgi:Scaffold protein Nfu/NifU N terminal
MGFAVRQVQQTPNPNAVKFILDREISDRPTSFFDAGSAVGHPLAERLFGIPGVSSVLILGDFVTINKSPQARWADIQKKVTLVLAEASDAAR